MTKREKFLELRKKSKSVADLIEKLNKIIAGKIPAALLDEISKNEDLEYRLELGINEEGKITSSPQIIDKTNWKHTKVAKRDIGDSLLIKALNPKVKSKGKELLDYVRGLHSSGVIIQNRDENRFTNYSIKKDGYYRSDSGNFVSFVPQKDCIKVFVLEGDYSFLSGIKIIKDVRYSYFKIEDSYQLPDAKEAIELSYYIFMGLNQ